MSTGIAEDPFAQPPQAPSTTAIVTRTLLAAGFRVLGFAPGPHYGEYDCERDDDFGSVLRYVFLIFDTEPSDKVIDRRREVSASEGKTLVCVAGTVTDNQCLHLDEFLNVMGGAVPTWRALRAEFEAIITTSALNRVPEGMEGLAWRIFEDAVADAFEFVLARRVRRMGGKRSGSRVPDMVTQIPDGDVIVIDTKASANPYDAGFPELRPLLEYLKTQKRRQTGGAAVGAAMIVAHSFAQDADRLGGLSREFLAESGVPVTFVQVAALTTLVGEFREASHLRNKVRWRHLLCSGAMLTEEAVRREIATARLETV